MKKLVFFFLLLIFITSNPLFAQDTLPKFSVKNAGNNRIIVSWVNNFSDIMQISVQRSFDSLRDFKTILTVTDPTAPQNGFVDTKATNDHMFYRLYIMRDKGIFLFSNTKQPVWDSTQNAIYNQRIESFPGDTVAAPDPYKSRPNGFVPSLYVFTNRDGYVRISLPEDQKPKKYSIKFFEEDNTMIFEIKEVKERNFKIDKGNFYHAGWFFFELYEDGKLFERHKFYLEKEF